MLNIYKNKRILVVDDEEFCIASMKAIMGKLGIDVTYQVDFCITGFEALDLVKQTYRSGMSYKLILTDFNMPVMDGIQSTTKILEFLKNEQKLPEEELPIIIGITGHVHQKFILEGLNAGMNKVIEKPCYLHKL